MDARVSDLHIAGVGASAGGLEAMLPMFAHMRPTGRIAYVVAQHMAKDGHDELVTRLIGRESALPVVLAHEGEQLRADTVYVIPSGKDGAVKGTSLSILPPDAANLSTPSVNTLFASIAEAVGNRAIGIVLSGTGSDGVAGCRALKARGGLTIAQDPLEAKFDGMPDAVIAAKLVDQVLSAGRIGPVLAELYPGAPSLSFMAPSRGPGTLAMALAESSADYADPYVVDPNYRELAQLLPQILKATSIDFSSYKEETLLRRLEKRKATLGVSTADEYQAVIRRDPQELHALQHLFLVSLSSFFRDRASFAELERALAGALADKPLGDPVRVWVPACASGEEPYTLAIMLSELLKRAGKTAAHHRVEIVATDLNPDALGIARAGVYRQTAFKEMDERLIGAYFVPQGQHYALKDEIKACVRFEQRDVLSGPPTGRFDLVSCRNLLIYLKSPLQDQLIKSFHQALGSKGLLFIGQSESLTFVGNSLFAPVDHYHRLFRRRH